MKKFSSPTQQTGELGEDIAARFLLRKGYKIIERNYTKKWGEIDIITQKGEITHFIEVKSVRFYTMIDVSHGTNAMRPEDHMDRNKQERLKRTIGTYLMGNKVNEWCFDLVCVFIDEESKKAKVRVMEDIIL